MRSTTNHFILRYSFIFSIAFMAIPAYAVPPCNEVASTITYSGCACCSDAQIKAGCDSGSECSCTKTYSGSNCSTVTKSNVITSGDNCSSGSADPRIRLSTKYRAAWDTLTTPQKIFLHSTTLAAEEYFLSADATVRTAIPALKPAQITAIMAIPAANRFTIATTFTNTQLVAFLALPANTITAVSAMTPADIKTLLSLSTAQINAVVLLNGKGVLAK